METNAAIIILAPVFLPVVQAMGVEPYISASSWLSTWLLALLRRLWGVNLFVAANVAQTTLGKICKGIVTIIGVMILD